MASLFLPSLNAAIIDEGVAKGDTEFIWRTGKVMLAVSLLQVDLLDRRHLLRRQDRDGLRPGRTRRDLPPGTGLLLPRAQPFRCAVADHPQHQRRAAGADARAAVSTMLFIAAPITMIGGVIMALREDVGLSWLVAVAIPLLGVSIFLVIRKMRPLFQVDADPDRPGQPGAARADHRHPGGPGVRPRTVRDGPLRQGQRRPDRHRHLGRPAAGDDLPDRDVHPEHVQRRGALVRRPAGRRREDADRLADRLPDLPDPDPDVGDDGDVPADDRPARRGLRRAHPGGAGHRLLGRAADRIRSPSCARPPWSSSPAPSSPIPGAEAPVLRDIDVHRRARARRRRSSAPPVPASRPWSR